MSRNLNPVQFEPEQFDKIYLPDNLDLTELLSSDKIFLSKTLKQNPRSILNRLVLLLAQMDRTSIKKEDLLKNYGFVNLSSKYLQSLVPNYREYLNWLIRKGVIKCNGIYKKGVTSYGYSYCIKYVDSERKQVYIYTRSKTQLSSPNKLKLDAIENLLFKDLETLSFNELRLDTIKNQVELNELFELKKMMAVHLNTQSSHPLVCQFSKRLLKTKSISWQHSIDRLRKGDYHFNRDLKAFRLHTNITNLKSEFRDALRYNGQKLYSLDIKNSQPLMVMALFNQKDPKLTDIIYKMISRIGLTERKMNNLLELMTSRHRDLIQYETLVKTGLIYEYFSSCLSKVAKKKVTRDQAKLNLLEVFFQPPRFQTKQFLTFQSHFPTIAKVIKIINDKFTMTKAQAIAKGYQKKDNVFSILLQRIESYIIIDQVCKKIKSNGPLIPIISIHDSIATTKQYLHLIKNEMTMEMMNSLQVIGRIKEEKWE